VIRQPAEGREYGLFLSYLLRRLVHALSMRDIAFPVLVVVDEAHEIFCGEKAVADAATISVQRAVLKGRSLGLGFVFSSQNPSQVPSTILNNLNTRIVHRLNSADELKLALPDASDELRQACMSQGIGEALVSIQGCRAPVRALMAPSPFKLTRLSGAGARRFLADEMEPIGEAAAG
jgi:DNA helicase HerA-like ATPase